MRLLIPLEKIYVDDMLKSISSVPEAVSLIKNAR